MEVQKKQSGLGIASLVLGIIGLLTTCIIIGAIPAVISLILALIVLLDKNKKHGPAIAGLVCSIVALVLWVVIFMSVSSEDDITSSNNASEAASVVVVEEKFANTPEPTDVPTAEPTLQPTEAPTSTPKPTATPEPTKSPQEIEQEYKEQCKEYKYKDVLRNPENYIGEKIRITVKISTVIEESWMNDCKYYFAYTNDEYGWWYGDQYVVFDKREEQKPKLLEDDIITVYGEIADPEYTSSLIISSSELFAIDMKYIDFISE